MKLICSFILAISLLPLNMALADSEDGIKRLVQASCNLDVKSVESILKEGVDPNGFYNGKFPLRCASGSWSNAAASIKIIDLLVDAGADPNLRGSYGHTALMTQVSQSYWDLDITQRLLDRGANIDLKNSRGESAMAIVAGDPRKVEIVQFLINAGADINSQDPGRYTPLMTAVYHGNREVLDIMLKAKPNLELEYKFEQAPHFEHGTVLDLAVQRTDPEIVSKLIKAGAKLEGPDRSALMAGVSNSLDAVKILVKAGANLNYQDAKGITPLMNSTKSFRWGLDIFKYLITSGADLNLKDKNGDTVLIRLSRSGTDVLDSISSLLDGGADPNVQNLEGGTAIMYVRCANTELIFERMIKAGVNLDLQDNLGETVLMKNLWYSPYVEFFIAKGANVNLRDKNGKTALGRTNDYYARKALIEAGGIE